MDGKDLEKMFEVIVSLEPMNPRPVPIDKNRGDTIRKMSNTEIEYFAPRTCSRKPSLSLAVSAPSARRGSMDTRKSLFQNERNISNFNRLTLYRANSKGTFKGPQELDFSEIETEDYFQNHSLPNYHKDVNVYETVSITIDECKSDILSSGEKSQMASDSELSCEIVPRSSLEIVTKKEIRYSNLSENACHNRNVEETKDNLRLKSAPQSARNSELVPYHYCNDNQSSIDSGVDQTLSINLRSFLSNEVTNSRESFSDISELNVTTPSEKEIFTPKTDSKDLNNWMNIFSTPSMGSETRINSVEPSQPKPIPAIKSAEEQNQFFRMISTELNLNSFSTKEIIKFFMRDGTFSSQIIDKFQSAITVCNILKSKYIISDDKCCQLIEVIHKESLERPVEDHENVLDIFYSWKNDSYQNKFLFEENTSMYKIFKQPSKFLDEMKCDFEISDTVHIRVCNSKWIRTSCFIRDGSIFYTSKPGSKDQKDLYSFVNLKKVDFYTCSDSKRIKKEYKAPTMDVIVFKEIKVNHKAQDNAYLAALSTQQKEKWLVAMKVAKYSFNQLKNNYLDCQMTFPTGFRSQSNSDVTIQGSESFKDQFSI